MKRIAALLIALTCVSPATGQQIWSALHSQPDRKWVHAVAFSPDGKRMASGAADNTIRLWDVATRTETNKLEGHTSTIDSIAFSPDGMHLASVSWDETIRLWDVWPPARR